MTDDMREAFERINQVPDYAEWSDRLGEYVWKSNPSTTCLPINRLWEGFCDGVAWQSQKAQGEPMGYVLPTGIKQLKNDHPATIYAPDNAMVPGSCPVWLYDQPPSPAAVPDGWELYADDSGVICLKNNTSGESILVPTYSERGDLWQRIIGQFLRAMLAAAPVPVESDE